MLQTVYIVEMWIVDISYGAGVSPCIQHLPELLSVPEIKLVHGNIGAVEPGLTEIFV